MTNRTPRMVPDPGSGNTPRRSHYPLVTGLPPWNCLGCGGRFDTARPPNDVCASCADAAAEDDPVMWWNLGPEAMRQRREDIRLCLADLDAYALAFARYGNHPGLGAAARHGYNRAVVNLRNAVLS